MIEYDHSRAKAATQFLVDDSYFAGHVRKLRTFVQKPRALPFKDKAEALNELLVIGRQNLQAMENLISVAEQKRDDRNEYQRKFMAKKRTRDRMVIAIQETRLGRKMTLDERKDALLAQYKAWEHDKNVELARYADATWEERNEVKNQFWAQIDALLPEVLEEAKVQFAPVARKRKVEVAPKKSTGALKLAMLQAMTHKK